MITPAGRLFLGIDLTDDARRSLGEQLRNVALPGRAVAPGKWHLTVRFLGDTSYVAMQTVRERLREHVRANDLGRRFAITFEGVGAFPRDSHAAVFWLGVSEGNTALTALAERAEAAAQHAGFAPETRPFSSHLTLSRMRPPRDLREMLATPPALHERMMVDALVLYRSHIDARHAEYEQVERFGLEK